MCRCNHYHCYYPDERLIEFNWLQTFYLTKLFQEQTQFFHFLVTNHLILYFYSVLNAHYDYMFVRLRTIFNDFYLFVIIERVLEHRL